MIRIVADTNVMISALISRGNPRKLVLKIDGIDSELVISKPMLEELISVMVRDRIRKYVSGRDATEFIKYIGNRMTVVNIKSKFVVIKSDPSDDIVINTAYSGGADYIVSGDKHLTSLRRFKGIKILTASEMLKRLK